MSNSDLSVTKGMCAGLLSQEDADVYSLRKVVKVVTENKRIAWEQTKGNSKPLKTSTSCDSKEEMTTKKAVASK